MNYKINIGFGGIFSKYIIGLQNLSNLQYDKFYFNITDKRTEENMFDNIFFQKYDNTYINTDASFNYTYSNNRPIELSVKFQKYKEIINNLNFNENLLEKLNFYKNKLSINKDTIGVHLRLTDMNIYHKNDHGFVQFEKYLNYFSKNKQYFVASDNEESLIKLKNLYGDSIKYIPDLIRGKHENEDTFKLQIDNFKNKDLWEQAFLEMLLLSECSTLICRTSNLSNAALIHSKTLKDIIRI